MHTSHLIEPLEDRIAPATLVSPTTVTFQDKNGDLATVTISKPLFTQANVAKIFAFDTGGVDGSNVAKQQLQTLSVIALGSAAKGLDISITATPVNSSPGVVDVGYIDSSNIDLGNVSIAGDLGRIAAGDRNYTTEAIHSLTIASLGARGLGTQGSGGTLESRISGPVSAITINGDVDTATIGVGGGSKGTIGTLLITGNLNGGDTDLSGSIRTQGTIGNVEIDGSIIGGGGLQSGIIGTSGAITTALVKGSVVGGNGSFSGALLSSKGMQSVEIDGSLLGGMGDNSGQVGTAGNLGTVLIKGAVTAGAGPLSGTVLATGNIASVTIGAGLAGGGGAGAGQIGSAASIGAIGITGGMSNGAQIHAHGDIQQVTVFAAGLGNAIDHSGIDAGGSIRALTTVGAISNSVFIAGTDLGAGFGVTGGGSFDNASATGFGLGGIIPSKGGGIGTVTIGSGNSFTPLGIDHSTFLAGIRGKGPDGQYGTKDDNVSSGSTIGAIHLAGQLNSDFFEAASIGNTTAGGIYGTSYIATTTSVTSGIGQINIIDAPTPAAAGVHPQEIILISTAGINSSSFTTNGRIGLVNVNISGSRSIGLNAGISNSTFSGGHGIGTITVINGLSGTAGSNYGIINTTFNGGISSNGSVGDLMVALTDAGPNGNSVAVSNLLVDASVCDCTGANLGAISVENDDTATNAIGIQNSSFRVHGNIGPVSATMGGGNPSAAAVDNTTFSAFGSIGDLNIYGAVTGGSRFLAGYDIGTDMTFGNEKLTSKTVLQGGQSIGNVTVTGYFEGSDIIASVNPGAGYVFGDSGSTGAAASDDSHVGKGGTIGLVVLGANLSSEGAVFTFDNAASHGIEAKTFTASGGGSPTVSAQGQTSSIPALLLVDDGPNDVRITDLSHPQIG